MTETNPTGDRPAAHQQRLLATTASDVEPHVHDALNRFCAASSGVEAGYVCRVEQVWPDGKATERLSFMLRLDMPVRERGDGRSELFAIANRLPWSILISPDRLGLVFSPTGLWPPGRETESGCSFESLACKEGRQHDGHRKAKSVTEQHAVESEVRRKALHTRRGSS